MRSNNAKNVSFLSVVRLLSFLPKLITYRWSHDPNVVNMYENNEQNTEKRCHWWKSGQKNRPLSEPYVTIRFFLLTADGRQVHL